MKLSVKLALTAVLGIGALVALFLFESFSSKYFAIRNGFEGVLIELESEHKKLDYEVLHSAFFVYANYDEINQRIDKITSLLYRVLNNDHVITHHKGVYNKLMLHAELNENKKQKIYDFQTVNSIIKNSTTAILALQSRLFDLNVDNTYEQELYRRLNNTTGTILLAKNGLDMQVIEGLEKEIAALSKYKVENPRKRRLFNNLITHFNVIETNFYAYVMLLNEILDPTAISILQDAYHEFTVESDAELVWINYFSYFLVALFIFSVGLISYFHIRSEHETRRDPLTGLKNRKAYEEDIKSHTKNLSLILLNISKFKHYNDFYGTHEGDRLLIKVAERIKNMGFLGKNAKYYRLGADDFGILFETCEEFAIETATLASYELFMHEPIIINGEDRTPNMSVASTNVAPLLENANMALKSKRYQNIIIYNERMNLREQIRENVMMEKELKDALEEDRVVPYFQPIVDLGTKNTTKHEVLARLITKDGHIRSIYPYLNVAKESRLYSKLTETIIKKSMAIIANSTGEFSINLSIEDINNLETVELIIGELKRYEGIGSRVIFEILESEAVDKYENIQSFISLIRKFGCKFAIDDFGSGYSNFAHILNLAVDFIKIDGSLIRYLDSDPKAITIVETIVNFARKASIRVVAEFVHNEKISQIVEQLQIDYAQGFYFFEPSYMPVATE